MNRRKFIGAVALGSVALPGVNLYDLADSGRADALSSSGGIGIEEGLYILEKGKEKNIPPAVRPEIRNNPRAVFLIETHVDAVKDGDGFFTEAVPQLAEAGKSAVSDLFVRGTAKGGSTLLKPNLTYVDPIYYNRTCGVMTSPDFVAGFAEGLRTLGNTNVIAGERIAGGAKMHRETGVYAAFDERNVSLIEASYSRFAHYGKNELNWATAGDSMVWKKIPHWRPIGDPDNTLINIATLKVHDIGITTLTVKNLQGAVPDGYGHFCDPWAKVPINSVNWGVDFKRDFHQDYQQRVEASFRKHLAAGYKNLDYDNLYAQYLEKGGWDAFRKIRNDMKAIDAFLPGNNYRYPDIDNLMRLEQWLQRGLDNAAVLNPALNIIEGIIGMDGYQHGSGGIGADYLCNIIVAGVSPYEVDAVGTYIMGHDPREVLYTRAAKERGLGECDVSKIDIYRIRNGEIVPVKSPSEIRRFSLGVNMHGTDKNERMIW
ncbi:DUF362 domain-containing protein [bacterium]|nr:DUF362 domain-containing protein [bacterium]